MTVADLFYIKKSGKKNLNSSKHSAAEQSSTVDTVTTAPSEPSEKAQILQLNWFAEDYIDILMDWIP